MHIYYMKEIVITGYSHCGTTILKSIIGHISSVHEVIDETLEINTKDIKKAKETKKKYILHL